MSYQVFARKYRPKTFADVLGQEHVVRTLRNAIAQNRLAHAYLFVGPRGTGKTSTARIFAKALNCPGGPSIDFNPDDPACVEIAEGRSLDVREIDGASNNGVEQVRELRENVNYAPASSRFKIYYIDEVHMLSTAAFNALLKTLEEPPANVKFIFATTEANKILPTIISRCQRFDLRRIPDPIIAGHLLHIAKEEGVELEEKAAYAIARGADGGMRDAQSMLDQLVAFCGDRIVESNVLEVFGFTAQEAVANLCESILTRDTVGALRAVHQQSEAGKDLGRFLADLIQHVRTLLVSQSDPESLGEELAPEMAERMIRQSGLAAPEQLLRIVDGLAEVDARMRWASNKRLHLELGVIQAVESMAEVSLSDVIAAIDKAGGTSGEAAAVLQSRRAAPAVSAEPRVATVSAPVEAPTVATQSQVADSKPVVTESAPVSVNEPEEPLMFEEPPVSRDDAAPADEEMVPIEKLWEAIQPDIQRTRPLIANWAGLGTQLGFERDTLTVGFPRSQSGARDSLGRDQTRQFLEGLLQDLTGQRIRLNLVVDESLRVPEREPVPTSVKLSEPASAAPVAKEEVVAVAEESPAGPSARHESDGGVETFYQDPLIDAVIDQLEARVAGRTFGGKS